MTKVTFRDDVTVELVDSLGTEDNIIRAATVSTKGADSRTPSANSGLLRYLYREKHGVPFESIVLQFYLEVPIFVSRQIVKHRLASINEESGRYKVFKPVFYLPNQERLLAQVGKTGDYTFESGTPEQYEAVKFVLESHAQSFWDNYEKLLEIGVSKEVARMHMPVNTYSSMYFTANLRSVLNFISKRKEWENASTVSHAQYEIALVTEQLAEIIETKFPTIWECFVNSGYEPV